VRLILIDPKMLELSVYEGIPHLLAPVVTECGRPRAPCTGAWRRWIPLPALVRDPVRNLRATTQRSIDRKEGAVEAPVQPYARRSRDPRAVCPLVVVVIDELADMMMVTGKKVDELIARIAQ